MDFENWKRQYKYPMPFCPWQGDMFYEAEIEQNLIKLEKLCREFCEPITYEQMDDIENYVREARQNIGECIKFLGFRNKRIFHWGTVILKKMEHPHPQQRYIEIRESVWIIFGFFGRQALFTWDQ